MKTHEEAIEAARLAILPMFEDDRIIPWPEAANPVIAAYLEARGAVLCNAFPAGMITKRSDNYMVVPIWINGYPPVGTPLHAALTDNPKGEA